DLSLQPERFMIAAADKLAEFPPPEPSDFLAVTFDPCPFTDLIANHGNDAVVFMNQSSVKVQKDGVHTHMNQLLRTMGHPFFATTHTPGKSPGSLSTRDIGYRGSGRTRIRSAPALSTMRNSSSVAAFIIFQAAKPKTVGRD